MFASIIRKSTKTLDVFQFIVYTEINLLKYFKKEVLSMREKYTIGLDYGTLSGRGVLARCSDGEILTSAV